MTPDTLTAPVETRPLEPTTPIKPSEALRLGRLIRPLPVRGRLYGRDGRACAVGAMAIGFGYDGPVAARMSAARSEAVYEFVESKFPKPWSGKHLVDEIHLANDCGYSDRDIEQMLRGYGL